MEGSARDAYCALQDELQKIREGAFEPEAETTPARTRFRDYAVSLLERRVATGDIKSAKTRESYALILRLHLFPAFGSFFIDEIRRAQIEAWRAEVGLKIRAGRYKPQTANTWVRLLKMIITAAFVEYEWAKNPVNGVRPFDESLHAPYSEEQPNALEPGEVPHFLAHARALFPQHYAMIVLGFVTGLRPSSLRPLRRSGPTRDLLLDEGILYVRRSHTLGDEVMETTKTGRRQRIALPPAVIDILREHIASLPEGPMRDSELLFPSETGGFRAPTVLGHPFEAIAKRMGLQKHLSPRAMRRTFQDLARAASVGDLVTRAVSGHATEEMQRHYSTVNVEEIRSSLTRVADAAIGSAIGSGGEPGGARQDNERRSA